MEGIRHNRKNLIFRTPRTARTYRTVRIVRRVKLEIDQRNIEWLNC